MELQKKKMFKIGFKMYILINVNIVILNLRKLNKLFPNFAYFKSLQVCQKIIFMKVIAI